MGVRGIETDRLASLLKSQAGLACAIESFLTLAAAWRQTELAAFRALDAAAERRQAKSSDATGSPEDDAARLTSEADAMAEHMRERARLLCEAARHRMPDEPALMTALNAVSEELEDAGGLSLEVEEMLKVAFEDFKASRAKPDGRPN